MYSPHRNIQGIQKTPRIRMECEASKTIFSITLREITFPKKYSSWMQCEVLDRRNVAETYSYTLTRLPEGRTSSAPNLSPKLGTTHLNEIRGKTLLCEEAYSEYGDEAREEF